MSNNPFQQGPISAVSELIPDECFLSLSDFQSDRVAKTIDDKEQHQKTVRSLLVNIIREKTKGGANRR